MNRTLSIRTWTEPFPDASGVAVVFDIFRCSTTIHRLAIRGEGPLYVAPSLEEAAKDARAKEMRVFSELSKNITCAERYDNSPQRVLETPWPAGRSALVATTTGTPAMFASRRFERVYVGSLNNFSALIRELAGYDGPVTLVPAAVPDWRHVEDEIAAQAVATTLEGYADIPEFVSQCAARARAEILASPRPTHLAGKLATGAEDVRLALELDVTDQVLSLEFDHSPLARVVKRA